MTTLTMLIGLATMGVDTGWQPVDDGGLEYIIQIEPNLLDALRDGNPITSEIPADLKGVRRYKIVVGQAELPRTGLSVLPPASSTPRAPTEPTPAVAPPPDAAAPAASVPAAASPTDASPTDASATGIPPGGVPPESTAAGTDRYGSPSGVGGRPADPSAADSSASGPADQRYPLPPALGAGAPVRSDLPDPPSETGSAPRGVEVPSAPASGGNSDTAPIAPAPGGVAFPPTPSIGGEFPTAPAGNAATVPPAPTDGTSAATSPDKFQPDPNAAELTGGNLMTPIGSQAAATPKAELLSESDHLAANPEDESEKSKPWLPLTMTIVCLFASFGGNLYLGWIAWDARHHYRRLVRQTFGREPTAIVELPEDEPLIVGRGENDDTFAGRI